LLIGTASAIENKNAVTDFEKIQTFVFDETAKKLSPATETQIKIGNGSGGGGVRMRVGGLGSSSDGSFSLSWIFIAIGIIVIIGLAYYLLKKEKK
jgi:hypothetical protein